MTVFGTVNMLMGFVISLSFSTSFSCPENRVMHPVGLQGGGSTKDQGPGYWNDAMDNKFGHWNWTKLVHLGVYLHF